MAVQALISKLPFLSPSPLLVARSAAATSRSLLLPRASPLIRLRPLLALAEPRRTLIEPSAGLRCFSSRPTTSSLNDPSPNWSNRPPKETILLDGCDFEHWLIVMEPPDPNWTRDEIIDSYIKTLAQVVGSEEEARMKVYSVSTKHYFAFGALVSEELSYKIKALPKVRWVLPDSYLDVRNKDYGGEPFIDGKAVPYDPKYHEEWVRNNARANERSRRNDRPRNFDRSRNFERRRENMQNFQNRDASPMPNQNFQNPLPQGVPPMPNNNTQNAGPVPNRDFNAMPPMPNNTTQNAGPVPNRDFNAMPPNNANSGGPPGTYQNQMPNPQNSYAPNDGRDMRSGPVFSGSNQGYQGNGQGYQGSPNYQQSGVPNYQQGGTPNYQQSKIPNYPQGGVPNYQQQGGGPNYQQGGTPNYQQQGSGPRYQSDGPNYQQGGAPNYQQQGSGPNFQSGGSNYQPAGPGNQSNMQGGGPVYQGRDMPGRD